MRIRVVLSCLAIVLCVASSPLKAQTIGFVDARRLVDEAPQREAEIKILEREFSERNRELRGRAEDLIAREAKLQKNAVLMSAEDRQRETDEIRKLERMLQRDQQSYNDEYVISRDRALERLEKLISEIIVKIAEEKNISLVLQQAVYASRDIDLTDEVLEELNRMDQQE